ncbi:MAG: peptidylprolyl isomerase [Candidatus Pelagibacter sp. TMED263]|nr:MAG: peptidylprolyl isomerase [Candidatus Pelagibacter sp. TMED263]
MIKKMILKKLLKFNLIYQIIFLILFSVILKANEVKIITKIGEEIITNIDIESEYDYLTSLNVSLKQVSKDQLISFAQNSLIKEKIKKNELLKFYELNKKNQAVDLMIEDIYKKLDINSLDEFKVYLMNNNLEFDNIYKKIEIESVWNEMIYQKFKDKIFIDEEELKRKILNNQEEIESLFISEIVINIRNKNEINKRYDEIVKNIEMHGFKETVLKFSISNSKNNSGTIGWINKNSLSTKIQRALDEIQIGEITEPILVSSGLLVLKLEDKKFLKNKNNSDEELQKQINFELNSQLNNFSRIYYDKIKKNFLDE